MAREVHHEYAHAKGSHSDVKRGLWTQQNNPAWTKSVGVFKNVVAGHHACYQLQQFR